MFLLLLSGVLLFQWGKIDAFAAAKEIKTVTDTYWITMYFSDNCWHICYSMSDEFDYYQEFLSYSLIDAAYEMLCWCVEERLIS